MMVIYIWCPQIYSRAENCTIGCIIISLLHSFMQLRAFTVKCHFVIMRVLWNSEQKRLQMNYISEACSIHKVPQVNWSCDTNAKLPPMEFPIIPCNFLPLHPILHSGIIFSICWNGSFPPNIPETARKWDFWVHRVVEAQVPWCWLEVSTGQRSAYCGQCSL